MIEHRARATVHGFPRIGPHRELKRALEAHWAGRLSEEDLRAVGAGIRRDSWRSMVAAGIDLVPCNDFSFYDHLLDAAELVGAVPERYGPGTGGPLATYFAMARGRAEGPGAPGVPAMGMTKWFDTNYHVIAPELSPDASFELAGAKPFDELAEALDVAPAAKPVLVGPVSFLVLSRPAHGAEPFDRLDLLDPLLAAYEEVLARLADDGASWVQLDEPAFAADRSPAELAALRRAYDRLGGLCHRPPVVVSFYFGHPGAAVGALARTPVEGIGVDLVAGPESLALLEAEPGWRDRTVFAGVVDGRGVWANDLGRSLEQLHRVRDAAGHVVVSSSCSLLHVPVSLAGEDRLEPGLRDRLAFAAEKLAEIGLLSRALHDGTDAAVNEQARSRRARPTARRAADEASDMGPDLRWVRSPATLRRAVQRERLDLPMLPATTIGSFPQTAALRAARAARAAGRLAPVAYDERIRAEIEGVVRLQERLGLDVLVHGEAERDDMVSYFAEQLEGFAVTANGWVQSYGSRCVRPPIIHGPISRARSMTLGWWSFAASLTRRPVKAMLTGPVTMVLWSFPPDGMSRAGAARQVAEAIRSEIAELEQAGAAIVQVDEPAFREGLPLRDAERAGYLEWAVAAFRLATGAASDATQVHTHMCYSDFAEILDAVAALDVDVISFEAARSSMGLLGGLAASGLTAAVGPGVYDVHSPRVPPATEMGALLADAVEAVGPRRLWVNPDCGLKTRAYDEVEPALANLVEAAHILRRDLGSQG